MKKRRKKNIFLTSLVFRCLMYLISVCILIILGNYESGFSFGNLVDAWNRWDSPHYLDLAQNGYAETIENGEHLFLVFYPLYPWLIRIFAFLLTDFKLSGMLISIFSYAIGCVYFYKITEKEFGEQAADNAVILISVFPFAFFFGSIATESLFFAVTAIFLYCLREHNWKLVALFGALACLTKVQGLLLCFSVLFELFYAEQGISLLKHKKWKDFLKKIIAPGLLSALMLLGFAVYLWINYAVEGDCFRFMYYQESHWFHSYAFIGSAFKDVAKQAADNWHTSIGMSIWIPELLLIALYFAGIFYAFRKKARPMYTAYLIAFFILTFSVTWLISGGRYTLSALPLFMLGGKFLTEHERWKLPVILCSSMLMIVYMTGYLMGKQIM